jgi:lysophospholipase L1-like esterase
MKNIILLLLLIISGLPYTNAQPVQHGCQQQVKTNVILMGDSWAYFTWLYKGFRESMRKYGHADKVENGMRTTAAGAQAETFLDPRVAFNVKQALRLHSEALAIVIFLGGNDVMSSWNAGETYENMDRKAAEVALQLDTIITYIREERPDIEIIIASYDFPNFIEPLLNWPENPYYDFWEGLEFPTMLEANEALIHGEQGRARWCDSIGVKYLNNIGLMQYVFGQKDPLPVWPYDPYPPKSVPFPGGDPRYPSPQEAMGLWGIDVYHLGPEGYMEIANNAMREYLMPMYRGNVSATYRSDGRYDGWVTDRGNTDIGELKVGRTREGRPVKGLLTFYTADIPADAEITHASLFVTRKRVVGGNPIANEIFPGNCRIDIKSGIFGSNVLPEASDFDEVADMEDAGCFVGAAYKNDFAFRVDLREEALALINKEGVTQFRIAFDPKNPAINEMGVYYGGGETEPYQAPYLDIYYKVNGEYVVTSTQLNTSNEPRITLYPNPASTFVTMEGITQSQAKEMKVYNAAGVLMSPGPGSMVAGSFRMAIAEWPAGVYFIQVPGLRKAGSFVKH